MLTFADYKPKTPITRKELLKRIKNNEIISDVIIGSYKLSNTRMCGVHFKNVVFKNTDLSYTNFDESIFELCRFEKTRLVDTQFKKAYFESATFADIKINPKSGLLVDCPDFSGAKFLKCIFTNIVLHGARFDHCQLRESSMYKVTLFWPKGMYFNLYGCTISDSEIKDAKNRLFGITMSGCRVTNLHTIHTDFGKVNAQKCEFIKCKLSFGEIHGVFSDTYIIECKATMKHNCMQYIYCTIRNCAIRGKTSKNTQFVACHLKDNKMTKALATKIVS